MKALITGESGFVGRRMRAELEARGWSVSGFDLRYPEYWRAYGDHGRNRFGTYHYFDVREMRHYPKGEPFDLVVHCAYAVGGRAAIEGVPMNLAHNLAADAALFEWALTTGQRRVLYFSSSAAYPVRLQGVGRAADLARSSAPTFPGLSDRVAAGMRLAEDHIEPGYAAEPDANYGWAKLTGERLAAAAAAQGLPVHVVRPFSGYGGDQALDYPFPALLWKVLTNQGEPIPVWGSAAQVRDWVHIDDVVRGALAIVDADVREPVNLCTGVPTSMESLLRQMWAAAWGDRPGRDFPGIHVQADRPMGVHYRCGDPRRQHEHYVPVVTLEEGILRALDTMRPLLAEGAAA
jgi:nucleoside-diphosphate-sugar epimerase